MDIQSVKNDQAWHQKGLNRFANGALGFGYAAYLLPQALFFLLSQTAIDVPFAHQYVLGMYGAIAWGLCSATALLAKLFLAWVGPRTWQLLLTVLLSCVAPVIWLLEWL